MKKLWCFLLTTLLFIMLLGCSASALTLTVEFDQPYDYNDTYMLRSGDTLHCLAISHNSAFNFEELTDSVSVAAVCYALEDGALVPCQSHCADRFQGDFVFSLLNNPPEATFRGIALSPQNQTYLIDWDYGVYQWTPQQAEPWQYLCTLDVEYPIGVTMYTADGDTLYACCTEYEDGSPVQGTVFAFSLESGACEELFTEPYLTAAYPVDETRMLIEGINEDPRFVRMRLVAMYLYDLTTGKKTQFSLSNIDNPVPDGRGGWYGVSINSGHGLYHFGEEGGNGEKLVVLSDWCYYDHVSLSEDRTTAYVCNKKTGKLGIHPVDVGEAPKLIMVGSLNEYGRNKSVLPDFAEFSAAHNNAEITAASHPATFDDLAFALVSGSDAFDLMLLELSSGNVRSLLDKGYCVDLSGNDSIAAYVQNLYPTWQKECVRDGKIVGVPIGMRTVWTFVANLELWNELDLGALPRSYDELFDCIEEWDRMGVLDEVPLFDYHGSSSFERLFYRIMPDFIGKCQREGRPITYSDETLLHLLDRLEQVRPILDAQDTRNMTGDGLIFEGDLSGIVRISNLGKQEVTADNSTFEVLPLGITDAEDCVESVIFTLLVINPKSQKKELAEAYLTYLTEHPTTWTRCYLLQDGPVGVRENGYEDLDEQYEQLISELDEKIMAAMKEGDDAVVDRWEQEKQALIDDYLNQWEVRPNMAEMLYQMMPYFTPLTSDGYSFLNNSCDDLTNMFLEGGMDSRTYAMRLDQRMRMAEMEGSN
ncbi:MAG: extracellular solute-binding protein [Christensenellaceae bacterium]|nr:extracellular solute-binding protein [Christensenellaceae bacterium]